MKKINRRGEKMNNNRNKTASGTDINHVKKQNAAAAQGQYKTEFASETNVQEVKQQNAASAQNAGAGSAQMRRNARNMTANPSKAYAEEYAAETNVQEVQKQNAQSEARKKNASSKPY